MKTKVTKVIQKKNLFIYFVHGSGELFNVHFIEKVTYNPTLYVVGV